MTLDASSTTWRYIGDVRFALLLGRAFTLQLLHPTVAAGVEEHSQFRTDPWGRLARSWTLVLRTVYDADGERVGARVRAGHERIAGVDRHGRPYHAYDPEAYWWVLATGFESLLVFTERLGRPLRGADRLIAYDETRELGRRFGLRDADMPRTLEEFAAWYGEIVAERLEDSPTVRDFLALVRRPAPPPYVPAILWPGPQALLAQISRLVTVGTLPPRVRRLLGIRWGRAGEEQLRLVFAGLRLAGATPARLRYLAPARQAFAEAAARAASRDGDWRRLGLEW